jgi:hypothetical protein
LIPPANTPGGLSDPFTSPEPDPGKINQEKIKDAVDSAGKKQEIQQTGTCSGCLHIGDNGPGPAGPGEEEPHFEGRL